MKKAICILLILLILPKISLASENDLVISEIMYDWPGTDSGHEWVEIFNAGSESVTVLTGNSGWRFSDGSNHVLSLISGSETVSPGQYFVIADNATQFMTDYPSFSGTLLDSSFSLNNTADEVGLSFEGSSLTVTAHYVSDWGASGDGSTLEKINLNQDSEADNWQVSSIPGGTPGQPNSQHQDEPDQDLVAVAACPTSLAVDELGIFDATGSTLPASTTASYLWDFGDQSTATSSVAQHSFDVVGAYQAQLTITAGDLTSVDSCEVSVGEDSESDSGSGNPPAQPTNYWHDIVLSEIMPNPVGSDSAEWIELYNRGSSQQDLSSFAMQDNSTHVFTFGEQIIAANQYLLIYKNQSGISLNNTGGDSVKLYSPDGEILDQVNYTDTASEGHSLARRDNNFEWTVQPTPGSANIFPENQPPTAVIKILSDDLVAGEKIIFSAADSKDPEEGNLSYVWDFGDEKNGDEVKENHIYEGAGSYQVRLTVTDTARQSASDTKQVEILEKQTDITLDQIAAIDFSPEDLILSEFLADPPGSDDGEWIEIYNQSDRDINLLGWQIDDQEGGSKPYIIKEEKILTAKSFLVVTKAESRLTLNNSNDSVRILTPLGEPWQEFSYTKASTGKSWSWDFENHEWFESEPSPGQVNKTESAENQVLAAAELDSLTKNSAVVFQGIALQDVASSSRSLYIADAGAEGWRAVEIYSSKKDWPHILTGDAIEVSGTVSLVEPITRIKISSADNIHVLGHRQLIEPDVFESDEVDQELIGQYIQVRGLVSKKSGKNIYLQSEQDSGVRVYYGWESPETGIAKDKEIIARGVLLPSTNNLKLLVMNVGDLAVSKKVLGDKQSGENSQDQIKKDNSIAKVNVSGRGQQVRQVLIYFCAGLVILLVALGIRKKLTARK